MARPKTDKREQLIGELTELFYEFGYDGTSLALITDRTGLGRASLYHHFPGGKEEMARAVLARSDHWSEVHVDEVLAQSGDPRLRLTAYLRAIDEVHTRPQQLTPSNAFGIGVAREMFGQGLRERLIYRNARLADLLVDCGVSREQAVRRAWEAKILMEGALVCVRQTGDMSVYRAVMARLPALLLASADAPGLLPEGLALFTTDAPQQAPAKWLPDPEART